MILLDTSVVSEPLRPMPDARVVAWMDAQVLAKARQAGRAIESADACIAAVALANGMTIATRDTSRLLAAGVAVIDPWRR
jgi:predicted nucleic acid-binding protein